MTTLSKVLTSLIALLHFYFLVLEMFLWTKPKGLATFGKTLEEARMSEVLAANMGLYNGFLAVGLIWALIEKEKIFAYKIQVFFLSCVLVAGIYGGYSAASKIFLSRGYLH